MNNQCLFYDNTEICNGEDHTIETCAVRCVRVVNHETISLLERPEKHLWMEWPDGGRPAYHWFD